MLSVNFLADSYVNTEAMARALYPFTDRTPLDALQVTTGARKEQAHTFALQLKQRYPALDVILRLMPDENPALPQRYPNPADYVASIAPWAGGGRLMIGVGNEAGVGDIPAQNHWYSAVIDGLGKLGIRVVTPSVQTHNPFDPAGFDSTYRMLAKYHGWFALHYYFSDETGNPIDPIHETVEAYCAAQGIPIQFAITELGYAYRLGAYAGYKGRLDSHDYALQLVTAARRWSRVKFFVYGFGNQAPWNDFDISNDRDVQDALVKANQESVPVTPTQPTYSDGTSPAPKVIAVPDGLKLRATPSLAGVLVRVMAAGETVTVYAAPVMQSGGFYWQRVIDSKGLTGWAANAINGQSSWVDPSDASAFTLKLPFKDYLLTSRFNTPRDYSFAPDKLQMHEGQDGVDDIARQYGSDPMVHAGAAGKVVKVGFDARGYGNYLILDFGNDYRAWYAHFEAIYVKEGQSIKELQILGLMGSTGGTSTAPHCHLTLQWIGHGLDNYVVADVIDPAPYLVSW